MLYTEKIIKLDKEVKTAVDKLFLKAFNNQADSNDLLLVVIHGFYNKTILEWNNSKLPKLSPYVFGLGEDGLNNINHYDFFNSYRLSSIIEGDIIKHKESLLSD